MRPCWAALWLLAPVAQAADDRVLLQPISTASVAVVGDVSLGESSIELADGTRVELVSVPTDTGGDSALRLFRLREPRPLAPMRPNTVCGQGQAVTFIAVAYPADVLDLPAWQRDEYRLAFYAGDTPPAIAGLRRDAGGDGLCMWGAWTEASAPGR
ncbi:MAG: hypothetical protein WAS21_24390 [Geminicoccaceae bacterium]